MPSDPVPAPAAEDAGQDPTVGKRPPPAAAERALAEAAARRAAREGTATERSKEVGGRDGPDPTRYGDWEINGLAADF